MRNCWGVPGGVPDIQLSSSACRLCWGLGCPPRLTARAPRHNCRCLIFHPGALADPTLLSTR